MSLYNVYVLGWFSMFVTWNEVGSRKNKQKMCIFETVATLLRLPSSLLSMSMLLMSSNPCMMFLSCVYALCIWMKCLEYLHLGIKCVQCVFVCCKHMYVLCVYVRVCVFIKDGCLAFLCFCVCIYICVYAFMSAWLYLCVCPQMFNFVHARFWSFLCNCTCLAICTWFPTNVTMCIPVCVCVGVGVCVCRCIHPGLRCHGAREAGGQHSENGWSDRRDPYVHHHPPRRRPHLQTQVDNEPNIKI